MFRISRSRAAAAAMAGVILAFTGVGNAFADNISADGDTVSTGSGVALSGNCKLPAAVASGQLTFNMANNDSPQHFVAGQSATLTYSSNSSQVTASGNESFTVPPTYQKNGDKFAEPFTTTIAAGASAGSATVRITAWQGGYSKSTTYAVTWNCAQNTAPSVSVTGVKDGASYEFGNVPAAGCAWTDDNDGSGTSTPTLTGPTGPRYAAGLGTVEVSCSKTDSGNLTGTASASYTVVDTTAPAIPDLVDVTAAAKDAAGTTVSYTVPDATDAVDGTVALDCAPTSGSQFALGDTTVTCTATDIAGNHSSKGFTVSVTDQGAPVITVPDDMTVDATSSAGATVNFADKVSAKDNVDGSVTPTCDPASGSNFDFGSTMVTCSAADQAGNEGSSSFTISVQDKSAPALAVPDGMTLDATGPDGAKATWDKITAADDIDSDVTDTVSCSAASGDIFPLGNTTVTCTAHDSHGNIGHGSFVVTVQDTTAPAITVPEDLTVEATNSMGTKVDFAGQVGARDAVDQTTTVTCEPASGSVFALDATTPVSCTSTDAHGNTAQKGFNVSVVDTTKPEMPDLVDVTAEATGPDGAKVDYAVDSASDTVDGAVAVTCEPGSGSTFALGDNKVDCTATDTHGNVATGSFTVSVLDTAPPTIDPVSVKTAEATGPGGAEVGFSVSAEDVVDPAPVVVCDHDSGETFPIGATDVKCTATDASGNSSDLTFTVNVADTTGPHVETVSSAPIEATGPDGAAFNYTLPLASDLVDGDVSTTVACAPAPGSIFPLGQSTGTCTAHDSRNNRGSSGFTVTVQDTTPPAIPDLPNLSAVAASKAGVVATYNLPKASDLVDGDVPLKCDHASGETFPMGVTTVNCSATDAHGNESEKSFTVTVGLSWSGFLAPVVNGGTYKLGSTIPFKFQLTGASAGITDLNARLWVRATNASASTGPVAATSTSAASDGNTFRWSSADKQYIFNLSTKPLQAGTYDVLVDLGDGVVHRVTITLR